ncbi:MAG: hypothetical protein PHE68_06125 [Candidatus Peribacteraceae bacterium]|nr:hypothetical protein [Candidatus Peribacteraceae bacterium]
METPNTLPFQPDTAPASLARETVTAGTHNALESLMGVLAPAATIGILAYGFKMMFRGVLGGAAPAKIIG